MTEMNDSTKRCFSKSERLAAFVAANGFCSACGVPLPADFHADHVIPHRAGGLTNLDNVQALCPACNLKKGGKLWTPKNIQLRRWQKEAIDAYLKKWLSSDRMFSSAAMSVFAFLAQATPGAGKTVFACSIARYMIDRGNVSRILVVSPSVNLREDWADEMSKFEIELDPECGGGKERTSEFIGKSATYHVFDGRSAGVNVERILQSQSKTLVILDEVHHVGDSLAWGNGLQEACKNARAILCLSGTPFRSDGNPIPFIEYNSEGQAIADYVYGYKDALTDRPQVCRHVYFPSYEGNLSWLQSDQIYKASFSDELDGKLESDRLKAALWSGEWLEKTIGEAQARLSEIRNHHPDAGGLIVAMDKKHAEHLARLLGRMTSSKPLVVTSDDEDAKRKIKEFRGKMDPWIIAIKMVSEGVDIKRLRVCVYLSNVITELFFRQVVGRIVRYIPGIKDQQAFFYIPADHRLVEMAQHFREERIAGLLKEDEAQQIIEDSADSDNLWDDLPWEDSFRVLNGESWHNSTIDYDGDTYTPQELTAAEQFAKQHGYNVLPEVMAKMLRDFPVMRPGGMNGQKVDPETIRQPAYQKHREIRDRLIDQEKKLLAELRERWLAHLTVSDGYKRMNGGLKRALNIQGKDHATPEQVKRRHQMIIDAVASQEMPAWMR